MKITQFVSILTIALMVLLGGCAGNDSLTDTKTVSDIISGDRPAMWQLSDSDTQIVLFGTFHLLHTDTQWQSPRLDAAMLAATTTYLEADTASAAAQAEVQQAVQQYGVNPPGESLSSQLGESRAKQFESVAAHFGIPLAALEPLRPWLATLTVTIAAMQQSGLDSESGADKQIFNKATAQGDRIRYLESAGSQIEVLASLDELEEFGGFEQGMEQLMNYEAEIDAMIKAWLSGDEAELEQRIIKEVKDVSPELASESSGAP